MSTSRMGTDRLRWTWPRPKCRLRRPPHWDSHARAAILGLSRDSDSNQIVTATLQAVAYQTKDLVNAMAEDGMEPSVIRVDGGMVENDWFLQFLADLLDVTVERPRNVESTVLGAAFLAGLHSGVFDSLAAIGERWSSERIFEPRMADEQRDALYLGWQDAVSWVRVSG